MFTYSFNNEFISIFFISLLCILYFYDDERCQMNFPVRDNNVLLYCIVLYCIVLYCIVLYCIVLYCIVLYCIVLYCIVLYFHEDNTRNHKLVVTGADPVPIEISEGWSCHLTGDLATSHEEANNIIVQQVLSYDAENAESNITVVVDDTDVFVLLLHYHHMANLKHCVLIESPIKGRTVVDIGKTVQKHSELVE